MTGTLKRGCKAPLRKKIPSSFDEDGRVIVINPIRPTVNVKLNPSLREMIPVSSEAYSLIVHPNPRRYRDVEEGLQDPS